MREYHRKHQIKPPTELYEKQLLTELLEVSAPQQNFTGEEAEGAYVDMHSLHEMYLNVKGTERLDYSGYLKKSTDLQSISKSVMVTPACQRYVVALRAYWESFIKRTQPLVPVAELIASATTEFHEAWAKGGIPRWQATAANGTANGTSSIDVAAAENAQQLEAHGLEALKTELERLGLKCGGSLQERAARLFLTKSTPLDKMPKLHLAKGGKRSAPGDDVAKAGSGSQSAALLEAQTMRIGELLAEVIEDTAAMVEKKQARTYEEIERDLLAAAEEEMPDEAEEEEEEEKPIYNPLNLPLGWDGKPIPYWLYKLHGLNLEFKCEICGNYSYWGPRAFERHFQEWRHAHGMQCLGIPNTKHFHGITLIEDAYTLWAKLKAEQGTGSWNPELDEEFEDKQGNVMNRKTYADLARQGLLD